MKWKNRRVDPKVLDEIRRYLSKIRPDPPRAEDTQFTVWGKFGTRPVRITYDRGELKGDTEVIKEIRFVVNQIKTGKNWASLVDQTLWRHGPSTIETPSVYKAVRS